MANPWASKTSTDKMIEAINGRDDWAFEKMINYVFELTAINDFPLLEKFLLAFLDRQRKEQEAKVSGKLNELKALKDSGLITDEQLKALFSDDNSTAIKSNQPKVAATTVKSTKQPAKGRAKPAGVTDKASEIAGADF